MSVADVTDKTNEVVVYCRLLTRKLSDERGKMRMKERKWVEM